MKGRPSSWNSVTKTKVIRVPEEYAETLLEVAHMLDAGAGGRYAIDGDDANGYRLLRTDPKLSDRDKEICRSASFWNIQGLCLLLTNQLPKP